MQSNNNNKYYIRSLLDKDLVLEVDTKGKVTIEIFTAAPSQQWEILERINSNNNNQVEHCIVNVANKQCLHVKEKSHIFSKTRRAVTKKDSAFIWRRTDQIIECLLYPNEKKRCLLDVKSESTTPGTHVIVYEENGGRSNQRFIFEPIIAKAATTPIAQQQQQQQLPIASMYPQPLMFNQQPLQQQPPPQQQQQQHAYQSVHVNIVLQQQQQQQQQDAMPPPLTTNYAELLVSNPYNFDTTFERDVLQRIEKDGSRLPPKPFVAVYQQLFAASK